jgi:hypothetical protein
MATNYTSAAFGDAWLISEKMIAEFSAGNKT